MPRKRSVHYVDNKKFLQAMIDWNVTIVEAEEAGDERPPVTNYINFNKISLYLSLFGASISFKG